MAHAEAIHRHYYDEMKLPTTIETSRYGYGRERVNWLFRFTFNWWSLDVTLWHRWFGGFSVAYQHPRWIPGWAKYGVLTGFRIFRPRPSINEGDPIPELCRYEKWSHIVRDRDLVWAHQRNSISAS